MDTKKDYYAVLGILPGAEEVVVRAAFRALAQRYHPDRFQGPPGEAARRMTEINEAYSVLSERTTRDAYDRARAGSHADKEYGSDSSDINAGGAHDDVDDAWTIAAEYYPQIIVIRDRLSRISPRLAFSFKLWLTEEKAFENAQKVADQLEREFLARYFGRKPQLLGFAKELLELGVRDAARDLNRAAVVLGPDVDADAVQDKIGQKYAQQISAARVEKHRRDRAERSPPPTIAITLAVIIATTIAVALLIAFGLGG